MKDKGRVAARVGFKGGGSLKEKEGTELVYNKGKMGSPAPTPDDAPSWGGLLGRTVVITMGYILGKGDLGQKIRTGKGGGVRTFLPIRLGGEQAILLRGGGGAVPTKLATGSPDGGNQWGSGKPSRDRAIQEREGGSSV